jgi:hypothetical protein
VAGGSSGWDLLRVDGQLQFNPALRPLRLQLVNTAALNRLDSDLAQAQLETVRWQVMAANELIGFSPNVIRITAVPGGLAGRFSVAADGPNVYLVYTVPEPTSLLLAGQLCLLARLTLARRRVQ